MATNQLKRRDIQVRPVSNNLVSWDSIPMCNPDACFLGDSCTLPKNGPCGLHVSYQDHIIRSLLEDVEKPTAEQLLMIGMHILPLYSQLLAFKMFAKASSAVLFDEDGVPKANPILKEIRSVMRSILEQSRQLHQLGLVNTPVHEKAVDAMLAKVTERGNPDYFEELMDGTNKTND